MLPFCDCTFLQLESLCCKLCKITWEYNVIRNNIKTNVSTKYQQDCTWLWRNDSLPLVTDPRLLTLRRQWDIKIAQESRFDINSPGSRGGSNFLAVSRTPYKFLIPARKTYFLKVKTSTMNHSCCKKLFSFRNNTLLEG